MARKSIRLDNQKAKATRRGRRKVDKQNQETVILCLSPGQENAYHELAFNYADSRIGLHRRAMQGDPEAILELMADPPATCARLIGIGRVE